MTLNSPSISFCQSLKTDTEYILELLPSSPLPLTVSLNFSTQLGRIRWNTHSHTSQSAQTHRVKQPPFLPSCFITSQPLHISSPQAPTHCPSQIHMLTVSSSLCLVLCHSVLCLKCSSPASLPQEQPVILGVSAKTLDHV